MYLQNVEGFSVEGIKAFTIMMKDTAVLRVDFDTLCYEVLNEKYLPYPIKGKLQKIPASDTLIPLMICRSPYLPSVRMRRR